MGDAGRETEIVLALSARDWSDRLHRFLADHGGARVRLTAITPDDLVGQAFDVLVIDDICSFLNARLVDRVRAANRGVVGVYDPVEFDDGRARLEELGVSAVVAADSHPEAILRVVQAVSADVRTSIETQVEVESVTESPVLPVGGDRRIVAVGGPPGGAGVTETAIALAAIGADRHRTLLIDCDQRTPSVAQRLGLAIHPNVRAALDALLHRTGTLESMFLPTPAGFSVLPGTGGDDWSDVRASSMVDLVESSADLFDRVYVDLGTSLDRPLIGGRQGRQSIGASLAEVADVLVGVGSGSPVGITRLIDWLSKAGPLRADDGVHLLVNRSPRDQFRRGEIVDEITRSVTPASLAFVPEDRRLGIDVWNGSVVKSGQFRRAIDRWSQRFLEVR